MMSPVMDLQTLRADSPFIHPGREDDLGPLASLLDACIDGMRAEGIDQWDDAHPVRSSLARWGHSCEIDWLGGGHQIPTV
jgi:hypothetical protein